jgi:zona occludens toxin
MIELRTGTPGSGKTLSMVEALSKMQKRWEKHPEEARAIYVHNINDLALPHAPMPTKSIQMGPRSQIVPDWDAMENGSLVIIDECQDVFPPRSSQTVAPPHVAWLNTHRHLGFDLWLTTQNPKLIDFSVRALINKHLHFRRLFGGQRSAVYEWDACSDSLSGLKDSVMTIYLFPKKAFQFYKSAEKHTKMSFKWPRWIIIPVLGLALSVFAVPRAYETLSNVIGGKGLGSHSKPEAIKPLAAASAALPVLTTQAMAKVVPVPELAASGAVSGATVRAAAVFAGCMRSVKQECKCFDSRGKSVDVDDDVCESIDGSRPVFDLAQANLKELPPAGMADGVVNGATFAYMRQNQIRVSKGKL